MQSKYTNKNGVKLLAAMTVFAMVACCMVFAFPVNESDGTSPSAFALKTTGDDEEKTTTVESWSSAITALNGNTYDTIILDVRVQDENSNTITIDDVVINSDLTIPAGKILIIGNEYYNNSITDGNGDTIADFTITINEGKTLTVAGTIYNNVGATKSTAVFDIQGKMVFTGDGSLYNVSAPKIPSGNDGITGFFISRSVGATPQYKQLYSANISNLIPYTISNTYSNFGTQTAIFSYGDVSISNTQSLTGLNTITLFIGGVGGQDASITLDQGVVFNGITVKNAKEILTVEGANTEAKVAALSKATLTMIAGNGGITLNQGSITVEGNLVSGTGSGSDVAATIGSATNLVLKDLTITSGTLTLNTNVSIAGDVTIAEGATLATGSNTVTNNGNLFVDGTITTNSGTFTNNGKVAIGDNSTTTGVTFGGDIVSASSLSEGSFGMKNDLTGDYLVSGSAFLAGDLTVPAGITLTITSDGSLDLNNHKLYILGTLVIENGGEVRATYNGSTSPNAAEGIYLGKDGKIQNDGMIGTSKQVTVGVSIDGTAQTGTADMMNVSGLNFGMKKNVSGSTVTYTLTVSGDLVKDGDDDAKLGLTSVIIDGDLTIGEDVSVTATTLVTIKGGSTVTVDGILNAGSTVVKMENKSTIIVNGYVNGDIVAETGNYPTANKYSSLTTNNTTTVNFPAYSSAGADEFKGVTSVTLTVGIYSYTDNSNPSAPVAMTSQRLYVSGDLDYVNRSTTTPTSVSSYLTLELSGNDVYVAEGDVLNIKAGMAIDDSGNATGVVVEGTIVSALNTDDTVPIFKGTAFKVKTEATATVAAFTTYYIKPFDVAIKEIDTADKKTLTVKDAKVIIDSELTLTEGQIVNFVSASDVTISSTGKVTINAKAKIDGNIDNVDGSLVKMTGASLQNVPTNYAAYVKGTGFEQWAGFQVAIDSAGEGETVTINKAVTISSDGITIPAGKTVIASENITVQKGSVAVAGKLILKDGAKLDIVEAKKDLNVTGEVDASDGIIDLSTTGKINSTTGKTTLASGQTTITPASDVNGTVYIDEDNNTVITTAQAAIDAAAAQDYNKAITFYGTVSADNVNIKVNATVDSNAVVSINNATIADKKVITINGKTSGTFTAQTGVVETTTGALSDSTITLDEAKGIVIGSATLTDSMNVDTKIFFIYGTLVGNAAATEGVISIGKDTTTNKTLTVDEAVFTVGEKATLDVRTGTILTVGLKTVGADTKAAVVVDGTLDIAGTLQYDGTKGIIDVNGILKIEDDVDTTFTGNLNVTGKIVVSTTVDKEASLTTNGVVSVYDGASIDGNIIIGDNALYYLVAFTGADMEKALLNIDPATGKSTAIATTFYINDDAYMTAYVKNTNVLAKTVIEGTTFSVDGLNLDTIKTITNSKMNWFSKEDCKDDSRITDSTKLNNNTPALYFKADKAEVKGTISAGVGLSIYLNGVEVDNYLVYGGYSVPVGTYKVTLESLASYDKSTATISFNGTTVADGGSITFTEDGFVLTATGATPAEPTPIQPTEKDEGMGITDYLLIVLVILAAILVVIVAIRMMRS